MPKRYSEAPKGALKGLSPIEKALKISIRHYNVTKEHWEEMSDNYRDHNKKIATDPDYAKQVYIKYVVNLASWYQAMEDLSLADKLAEIMTTVKKRAREVAPEVEEKVYRFLGETVPGFERPKKKAKEELVVEIFAR